MPTTGKKIMSAQDIDRALSRIALQILEHNNGAKDLAIIGIHTGGVYLAERIKQIVHKREKIDLQSGSLDITLYRDDWSLASQNPLVKKTNIAFPVEEKTIVLVDDVIFTGRTIRAALDAIMDFGRPRSIQLAVLVDRNGRELPIQADYVGISVTVKPDELVHVRLKETNGTDEIIRTSSK
jgi:pyrimidine operon attenuation protein/uracil phosphoribosyltransferase